MARPIPRLPPVTTTLCILAGQLAGWRHVERRNEAYHRRHLVIRKRPATIRHDLVPNRGLQAIRRRRENDVGDHDGTGDWAAARSDPRHTNLLMPIYDGLDLLGMNLEPADI